MKNNRIIIGKVLGAHGIRGELKVLPLTDDPGRFYELESVYVNDGKTVTERDVELVRLHKGRVLLSLEGIGDRNQSEALKDALLEIDRDEAVALEENEYFIEDLIGMTVQETDGTLIGHVKDVLQTSGTVDTVEIRLQEGRMIYVPARQVYFTAVDLEAGVITAAIPEELKNL